MCGRYTLRSRGRAKFYGVTASQIPLFVPRYNIAPSQDVPVILERGAEREIALFQWGLIPSWSKEPKGFINARAETLQDKPSFSESFQRRRCLIPADGFFEWARRGRSKQPYYFQMKDESPFAFAGIWDKWQRDGVSITSCAIITTTPNELLATIHDRMPVILNTEAQERWLRSDSHRGKFGGPILTIAAPETHLTAVDATKHSVTIELQFMKPFIPGRWLFDESRELR